MIVSVIVATVEAGNYSEVISEANVLNWCNKNLKYAVSPRGLHFENSIWVRKYAIFDNEDAVLFKLRWS